MVEFNSFDPEVKEAHKESLRDRFEHIMRHLVELIHTPVGSITVVCGPMFAGKSSFFYELDSLRENYGVEKEFHYFKPTEDDRQVEIYSRDHESKRIEATRIPHSREIIEYIKSYRLNLSECVFCFDEGQFSDEGIIMIAEYLRYEGAHVVICGLDMTFEGKPFPLKPIDKERYEFARRVLKEVGLEDTIQTKTMGDVMAIANFVVKICARNEDGTAATHSMRIGAKPGDENIQTGDSERYEPTSANRHNILTERIAEFKQQHGL